MIPVKMVGSKKLPSRATALPPRCSLAPFFTASSTCLLRVSSASLEESGPSVVLSSSGSPIFTWRNASLNFVRNASAIFSCRIKRLAAVHTWPALFSRAWTPIFTARSRSASSSTTNTSLPPSSSVDFLICFAACAATTLPAFSDPVSAAPCTRSSAIIFATCSWEINRLFHAPSGAPASRTRWAKVSAQCGTMLACLAITGLPAARFGARTRISW